jgi:hypothetical protein
MRVSDATGHVSAVRVAFIDFLLIDVFTPWITV